MTHDLHDGPADAILYDGCGECDHRASEGIAGALHMDPITFSRMWSRMMSVERGDGPDSYRTDNEARVGKQLYYLSLLVERHPTVVVPFAFPLTTSELSEREDDVNDATTWWLHNTATGRRTLARMMPLGSIPLETRRRMCVDQGHDLGRDGKCVRCGDYMEPRRSRVDMTLRDGTPYHLSDADEHDWRL